MSMFEKISAETITHLLPIQEKSKGNIDFCWGNGNNLVVFKGSNKKNDTPDLPYDSNLCEVKWEVSLHSEVVRKLINESHGIFVSLQKLQGDISSIKPQLVKISHMYRSVIKVCIENLLTAAEKCSGESKNELNYQCQIFYKIELIWNLCEILFIDIQPGGVVMCQLLDWIQWHFSCRETLEELLKSQNAASHPQYWETVYSCILQGKIDEARKILRLHPDIHSDHFQSMDELLSAMPLYSSFSKHSVTEFNFRWSHWQEECVQRFESGEFVLNENLTVIIKILCGDREIFQELLPVLKTWYHLLVSFLLYTNPTFKGHEFHQIAEECIRMCGGTSDLSHLDSILFSAFEFDLQQVIKGCYGIMDQWFVAHLTDLLLFHCDDEAYSEKLSHGPLLRESLILDYAASLISHKSLWQIAVDYFDSCQNSGRYHLELHLERIPIDSEYKALKVIAVATKHNMNNLVLSVCKVMGHRAFENKRYGSALTWAIRSKHAGFTSYLADKFLSQYVADGKFTSLDILDNLGQCMLISDRLTFLGKYREFHKMYEAREFKDAAALLVSLLTSQIAPKYFWLAMLLDALPLLESKDLIFSSNQVHDLMFCFEELKTFWNSTQANVDQKLLREKEELIRTALARNLARSFIEEGTDTSR